MKPILILLALIVVVVSMVGSVVAQEKMTKDEWQAQMTTAKNRIAELTTQIDKLTSDKSALTAQSTKLDADVRACEDALYALLGITRADAEAFEKELSDMEKRVDDLQKMSDEDLATHRDEIERMDARLKEMMGHKMAMIPRYKTRISSLQDRVAGLLKSINKEKTYTVGTWSRDRDCLWNIAKKKDVYANAWMWPKIWQGNRDKIKDPDVIKPRWVLKIPEGSELNKEEKSSANRYYRKKAAAPGGN